MVFIKLIVFGFSHETYFISDCNRYVAGGYVNVYEVYKYSMNDVDVILECYELQIQYWN